MSINVQHATKVFDGQAALNNVSLKVPSGQVLGLLGPNGAGKSTAMKAMLGMLDLNAGKVTLDGKEVAVSGAGTPQNTGESVGEQIKKMESDAFKRAAPVKTTEKAKFPSGLPL